MGMADRGPLRLLGDILRYRGATVMGTDKGEPMGETRCFECGHELTASLPEDVERVVERLRDGVSRPTTILERERIADCLEALTRENAALRADKERLERERDHWLGEARRLLKSGQDALDKLEAAERRQGQAQGKAEICTDCKGTGEYSDWGGECPLCGGTGGAPACDTPPSPEPDAELVEAVGKVESFINEPSQYEDQKLVRDYRHELYRVWSPLCSMILRRHHKQGGA